MKKRSILFFIITGCLFVLGLICAVTGCTQEAELSVFNFLKPFTKAAFPILKSITVLGNCGSVVVLVAALLAVPKRRFRLTVALPTAAATIVSVALNEVIKALVARPRPAVEAFITEQGYSFPSGHAMNNGTFYFTLFWLIFYFMKKGWLKNVLLAATATMPFLIAFTRVAFGVHYVSDVLAGLALGAVLATVTCYTVRQKIKCCEEGETFV